MTRLGMKVIPSESINVLPRDFSQWYWWYGHFISQIVNCEDERHEILMSVSSTTWKTWSANMTCYSGMQQEAESRAQESPNVVV